MTLVNKVQPLSVATGNAILDFMCGPRFTSGSNIGTVIILFNLFILGKGIPKALSSNKRCSKIGEHFCLPVETAVQLYQQDSSNAQLKRLEVYGDDSLHRSKELQETQNALFFFIIFQALGRYSNLLCQVITVYFKMQCFTLYIYLKY